MTFIQILADTPIYICDGKASSIDGEQYLPILRGSPQVETSADVIGSDLSALVTGEIVLSNGADKLGQGIFDNIDDLYIIGKDVKIFSGDENASSVSNLISVGFGVVENYEISPSEIRIFVQDKRERFNPSIPEDEFNSTDYADIESQYLGKRIPILVGPVREIPCIPVNGQTTGTTIKYKACDFLTSLGSVFTRSGSGDEWQSNTAINISLVLGEFEIASAKNSTTGEILQCKLVDPEGYAVDYCSDIIKVLNDKILSITYNDTEYNTTEWEDEETLLGEGGIYISESEPLNDIFSRVQKGAKRPFRYDFGYDGRRTIKADYPERAASVFIQSRGILNLYDAVRLSRVDLLATEVIEQYKRSYVTNLPLLIKDASGASEAEKYVTSATVSEETILYSEADATTRANERADLFQQPIREIELDLSEVGDSSDSSGVFELQGDDGTTLQGDDGATIEGTFISFLLDSILSLRVYDYADVELVLGLSNLDQGTIIGREYLGVKRCKIVSVAPDPGRKINRVRFMIYSDSSISVFIEGDDGRFLQGDDGGFLDG